MKRYLIKTLMMLMMTVAQAGRIGFHNCAIDENGCMPCAGYTWCSPLKKCVQLWIEECVPINTFNITTI